MFNKIEDLIVITFGKKIDNNKYIFGGFLYEY